MSRHELSAKEAKVKYVQNMLLGSGWDEGAAYSAAVEVVDMEHVTVTLPRFYAIKDECGDAFVYDDCSKTPLPIATFWYRRHINAHAGAEAEAARLNSLHGGFHD